LAEILRDNPENVKLAQTIALPQRLKQFEQTLKEENKPEVRPLLQEIYNLFPQNIVQNQQLQPN
jgi:hypothetical protein